MPGNGKTLMLVAIFVIAAAAVIPYPASGVPYSEHPALSGLDTVIASEMNRTHALGVVVIVVQNGTIAYARGFGTDRTTGQPMTQDTVLAIGSTTKLFTGYLIASLAEDGSLDPDTTVRTYIPELDPSFDRVTTTQLITHSSGLRDWDEWGVPGSLTPGERADPPQYMKTFNSSWFFTSPGAVMSYSNPGVNIAGFAAARAARSTYRDLVRDRITVPAGMHNTSIGSDMSAAISPCGWIISTGNDMAALAIAMMDNSTGTTSPALSRQAIRRMTTYTVPVLSLSGTGRYGYGTEIVPWGNVALVGHRGDPVDGTCIFWTVPEKQSAVIIITNSPSNTFPDTFAWIMEHGMSEPPDAPPRLLPVQPDRAAQVSGNYTGYAGYPYTVSNHNGSLVLTVTWPNWAIGRPGPGTTSYDMLVNSTPSGQYVYRNANSTVPQYIGFVTGTNGNVQFLHLGMRAWQRQNPSGLFDGWDGMMGKVAELKMVRAW
ncbi:MAG: serine hydrolase [Methanoregula sp.]|nr:serine hydrolase [Methanoregula sp.]